MGFDPLSEEGLHIINDWVSRGNQARADFAEYQAAGEREAGWKKDLRLFKDNPTQLNLNNLIQNYHTINFEWNSSSNKFVIKSNDLKTDIKQIGLKAFKEVMAIGPAGPLPLTDNTGAPLITSQLIIAPIEQKLNKLLSNNHYIEPNE